MAQVPLNFLDASGDGTALPMPGLDTTVYNGSQPCKDCGTYLNPLQALSSNLCPGCSNRRASNHVANLTA